MFAILDFGAKAKKNARMLNSMIGHLPNWSYHPERGNF